MIHAKLSPADTRTKPGAMQICEHLTFVTCRVCGLTYEERQTLKQPRAS